MQSNELAIKADCAICAMRTCSNKHGEVCHFTGDSPPEADASTCPGFLPGKYMKKYSWFDLKNYFDMAKAEALKPF